MEDYLVRLFVDGEEKSLNDLLKENGHYEYDGGTKKVFNG